ncbi:hypothetical protein Tco_0731078 [Tanacetum coccineum]
MSGFESIVNNGSKGLDVRGSEQGLVIGNNASKKGIETKSTIGMDKWVPLRSCLATKVIVGNDGRPMKAGRCAQFDYPKETLDNQRTNEGNTTNGVDVLHRLLISTMNVLSGRDISFLDLGGTSS